MTKNMSVHETSTLELNAIRIMDYEALCNLLEKSKIAEVIKLEGVIISRILDKSGKFAVIDTGGPSYALITLP